jgi:hypothetical protein
LEARDGAHMDQEGRDFRRFAERSGNDMRALVAIQRAGVVGGSGALVEFPARLPKSCLAIT